MLEPKELGRVDLNFEEFDCALERNKLSGKGRRTKGTGPDCAGEVSKRARGAAFQPRRVISCTLGPTGLAPRMLRSKELGGGHALATRTAEERVHASFHRR